ncbi:nucleotidyltransferase family protein [Frankia sp. AgB1.9]|uniref:nucleotidyltransferase family protein n=1 Tax=unclassified Frankia TaxID=2632575 RepID=UPI00193235E2|nr:MULTISPECIES: nucleotidyltransferase family protein [unclassified Frankia]MBL7494536.1 nucleotidyltransferase family protein [Frankia sp. AgW1.1]MBL7550119.1 nucleotidyltransferase family protein [Frankia sp. AgB1.9]MBL7621138.1 nucleotidyltransferase family protein [Frankia sp. AgB1.8]
MTLEEIRALHPRLATLCRQYGIAELAVFGSVARGSAGPTSDVDILYVRAPGNDLGMSYFDLQDDLERVFGRPVDLVSKDALHRMIRDEVLGDAQVLYAA